MKKKLVAVVLAVGIALTTAGCSTQEQVDDLTKEVSVTLKDGRELPCIKYDRSIDCDWSNAK